MKRRLLALVLVVSLIASMCTTAFAGNHPGEKTEVNYVSLGDSMTNGYGLPGYDLNSGVEDYGDGSYANLFAQWLEMAGVEVDHAQLAMSAMRAEDLHWLLELDYTDEEAIALTNGKWDEEAWYDKFSTGDYWTWDEICTHSRTAATTEMIANKIGVKPTDERDVALIAQYYQEKVQDADIISLGMGNGNFGVFMFGRIMEAIGFGGGKPSEAMVYNVERAIAECEPEMQEQILNLKDELYTALEEYVGVPVDDGDDETTTMMEAFANTVVYTSISYVLNYAGSVEAILRLNPDAEIILVALMNTFADEGASDDITIGDVMNVVFTPLNAYIAALPTYMQATGNSVYADATFYYAEAADVECIVEVYGDEIYNDESVVRSRFIESIVGSYNDEQKFEAGMVWGMMAPMVSGIVEGAELKNLSLGDIEYYDAMSPEEKAVMAAGNTDYAISCALYLAFENAIIEASQGAPVGLSSVLGLGNLSGDMFAGVIEEFKANIGEDGTKHIDVAASIVANGSGGQLDEATVKALVAGGDDAIYAAVAAKSGGLLSVEQVKAMYDADDDTYGVVTAVDSLKTAVDSANMICMLLAVPETLSNALQNDAAINGLLSLFARCVIGNGLGAHPSAAGHEALSEAVIEAYDGEYTAADETKENLIIAAEILADLVAEYYDEAYAYAYDYAEEQGYIEATTDGIDEVIATLEAIDVSGTEMTDEFKAELDGEIAKVIETLEAAKALITEADVLNQDSLDALMAMLNEADEAIANIQNLLKQAGVDVNDLVIVPALEKAYDKLVNEVIPAAEAAAEEIAAKAYEYLVALAEQAGEDLAEAYDAFVEAFLEFLPEADAWLYDWFYNNPDKVIAFFEENGEFFVENAEAAVTVLGYIAYTFGPDVLEWVMENPEEALEQFVSWYEKYGERTWAMILVYLEELGVIDAAEDLYGCIEDALADLYEQLEDCTDEAYAEIMEQIEVLRAQLDALRAEIEAAASELNAAIYEQLMKGLDEIDALLNELEAIVKGEVEASIEEIKALIAELDAAIEDLLKTIANDVEGTVQGAIQAAVEAIKEQLSYIDGAAEWLEEAVAEAYEAFIDALLEALPYIDEALYDFFYNNPDKVIAFFEENGEFFAENADAVLAVLGYIAVEFGDDALEYVLNNPEEALEQFVEWYEKYGERTWAMILVYLNELGVLDCLPTEEDIKAAIEAIEKQIEDCYKQLENATGEALEELEATIEELKATVEELKAMVEDYAQMLDDAVRAEIDAAIEKLENAVAELEAAASELKAAIEAQIEEAIAKAEAAVKEALAKVEEAIAKVEAAVNGVIADVNAAIEELYAALENAKEELVAGAAQIVENLKDALADLYDVIVENAEKIDDAVLAEILAAIEDIEDALEKLDAIIKGAADAAIEDVAAELKSALAELQDAVEALIEAVEDNADEIIEEAVAAFEQAYLDATTDEYTITKDSYYVAIGDETVLAEPSYVDMLAEALEVEYTKIGEEGLTVAGTEAVLMQNIAEIVKADLITLGYSNNTMISFMIDQATSLMPEELDWSVYGYDELGEYVDAALSDITEELYAQGMDAQTTGLMVTAIESYAFAYTGYMVGYPMVVEAIHEINPEALVIMVGMNNALTDVTLEAEGVEIELGEYVQYLVDAANIESLAYAMLTGNAIYVDAPAVETLLEAYDVELGTDMITVLQLLAFPQNRALLNPSEAGHDYIKEQILNALELDYEYLLGDVNLDGRVNSADTNMVYCYVLRTLTEELSTLQMWAADVNEDGVVNSADTNMLYCYVLRTITALGAQAQ